MILSLPDGWHARPPADPDDLAELVPLLPDPWPRAHLDFLAQCDGGQGAIDHDIGFLLLDPAQGLAATLAAPCPWFPGLIRFGSNGGGDGVAFDARGDAPWPIVAYDMTKPDLAASVVPLAPDFGALMGLIRPLSPA